MASERERLAGVEIVVYGDGISAASKALGLLNLVACLYEFGLEAFLGHPRQLRRGRALLQLRY